MSCRMSNCSQEILRPEGASRGARFCQGFLCLIMWLCTVPAHCTADDEPKKPTLIKHQITGLFSKDRERDLAEAFKRLPDMKLVGIDFDRAEASVEYDVTRVFSDATPEQIIERFDNLLRGVSRHTFGVKPLCTTAREKLQFVKIPVVGLDCKACCLGAYEAIYRIDGVEQATASFKDGLVTAWIHPDKTSQAALEEALRQRGVEFPVQNPCK